MIKKRKILLLILVFCLLILVSFLYYLGTTPLGSLIGIYSGIRNNDSSRVYEYVDLDSLLLNIEIDALQSNSFCTSFYIKNNKPFIKDIFNRTIDKGIASDRLFEGDFDTDTDFSVTNFIESTLYSVPKAIGRESIQITDNISTTLHFDYKDSKWVLQRIEIENSEEIIQAFEEQVCVGL